MGRLIASCLLLCSTISVVQAGESLSEAVPESVKDPFYGQVLFDFYQQDYFSAITHLGAAQQQGRLPHHGDEAGLLLGGLYLAYGMQKNAEAIFNELLERQADPQVDSQLRNRVWLALAGIYYARGYEAKAAELLTRITAELPPPQADEKLLLESTLLSRQGHHAEAAARLASHKRDSLARNYVQYNLGVEQIREGREQQGRALLEELAQLDSRADPERAALRDKANVALGYSWLRREQFGQARGWFEQVQLHGPFASQALLGLGWVEAGLGNGTAAIATWLPLTVRNTSDPAVLEGLLAVPYTLNQLGARQQALDHYKKALDAYDNELKTLQAIISGMDFTALAQELVDPRTTPDNTPGAGWQWRAEIVPSTILGPYLYPVMAGHEFQEALRNYRDLLYLDKNLAQWQADLDAYAAMVEVRQTAYTGRLPQLQAALARLDGNTLQQQRERLAMELHEIEMHGAAAGLAGSGEQQLLNKLQQIEARLQRLGDDVDVSAQQRKLALLRGVLLWQLETDYPARLWQVQRQFRQLDETLAASSQQRHSLSEVLTRSPSDFNRYRQTIGAARGQMVALQQQARGLARQYEGRLQQLTVAALQGLAARIEDYRGQALFAAAQIYDRALQAQREELDVH